MWFHNLFLEYRLSGVLTCLPFFTYTPLATSSDIQLLYSLSKEGQCLGLLFLKVLDPLWLKHPSWEPLHPSSASCQDRQSLLLF